MAHRGTVHAIYVAEKAGAPMRRVDEAQLVAGLGIAGDRYHAGIGEFSPEEADPDHELTLVELEQVHRFRDETGIALEPGDLRRNVVTTGVDLNALVGRTFRVGDVHVRGIRLCEPCRYLAKLVGPQVLPALVHRAGLRAAIVEGGTLRPGDPVAPPDA